MKLREYMRKYRRDHPTYQRDRQRRILRAEIEKFLETYPSPTIDEICAGVPWALPVRTEVAKKKVEEALDDLIADLIA